MNDIYVYSTKSSEIIEEVLINLILATIFQLILN